MYYDNYCTDIIDPALYLVRVDQKVAVEDGFNFNGTNYHVIICGTENESRVICDSRAPLPHLINEYEPDVALGNAYLLHRFEGINYNLINTKDSDDPISFNVVLPSTIKVKRSYYGNGEVVSVNFSTYCNNVTLYEIGYNSWDADALKAGALAIRNFAWHKIVTYGTSANYHLADHGTLGAQIYNPGGPRQNSQYPNVINAMSSIWNTIMVNSDRKLFLSEYRTGTSSQYGTQYGGILTHYGAKRHADEGRSYSYILKWYYSYATKRSTGDIIVCSSHAYPSTWVKSPTQHYRLCNTCGYRQSSTHTFVIQSSGLYVCSVCGYTTSTIIEPDTLFGNIINFRRNSK
ncbi:MAG: hypothetical protein IJA35_03435 [Clostridia bacterium]|nr:hypothetical protein [Clostridia bacterium]